MLVFVSANAFTVTLYVPGAVPVFVFPPPVPLVDPVLPPPQLTVRNRTKVQIEIEDPLNFLVRPKPMATIPTRKNEARLAINDLEIKDFEL